MGNAKVNCWEDRQCGREPGGSRVDTLGPCPAATDTSSDGLNDGTNAGRLCWAVAGTLCECRKPDALGPNPRDCASCAFFRRVKYEEGTRFQLLKPGLGVSDPAELHRLLASTVRLVGICRDIFACLALRPLLERIAAHAVAVTRAAGASVYLLSGSRDALVLEASAGQGNRPERIDIAADTPAADAARLHTFRQAAAVPIEGLGTACLAAVPIGGRAEMAGVLELVKAGEALTTDDEWFLRELGLIASLGMENAALVDDLRQLRRFDKAKSRFVALLMHQIGSPLATVSCSLQALKQLRDKLSREDRDELIQCGLDRIDSVQALSRKLLDLAAIRSGKSLAARQPVCVSEPLRHEIDDRVPGAAAKGVELTFHDASDGAMVSADPGGLRVIFGNLLDNAIKYSTGADKSVEVEVTVGGGRVRACVRDHGIGIPDDEQSRIFEELHRASNAAMSDASGFGLGLAVVRELVDRYGGRIDLRSKLGVGTAITIEFPLLAGPAPRGSTPS